MRWKHVLIPALAVLTVGGWLGVRARIRATALAGTAHDQPRPHQDKTPHGGTDVVLGDEAFHLELLRDPAAGTLRVYVLDGEMETFVRIRAPRLDLRVERGGRRETLALMAVADAATGETVGDTCLFEGRAGWLKQADRFKGVFPLLAIQDQTFRNVAFAFPEGSSRE
jgi:hypothetical protein